MSPLFGKVRSVEPKIVDLQEPLQIIGLSVKTSDKKIFKDAAALGKAYSRVKEKVPYKKEPWIFIAATRGYDRRTRTFEYIMGDAVTSLEKIPDGMISLEIPAITYAVFPIRPANRFMWGLAIARMKRYIYSEWLPKSKYELTGNIGEFEWHDNRSTGKKPEIQLYVAIEEKAL